MSFAAFDIAGPDGDSRLPNLGPALLDCGAFSVLTGFWESLPTDDHVAFVRDHYDAFRVIAAPDVIGDACRTLENLQWFVENLELMGVWQDVRKRVMITYHLVDKDPGTGREMLAWAAAKGIEWLAVGGIVVPGTTHDQRHIGIESVYDMVSAVGHPFKTHLFGGYHPDFIRHFKPDAVDSSTYIAAAKSLSMTYYDGWRMVKRPVSRRSESEQLNQILTAMYELGVEDPAPTVSLLKRLPDGVRLWYLNALGVVRFEEFVRRELNMPDFRYWVTIDVSMPLAALRYGTEVCGIFADVWRDRCLLAYPSFWAGPNMAPKWADEIHMFEETK